jgi:hypothetical protein
MKTTGFEKRSEDAHARTKVEYTTRHGERWRNEVAAQLNTVLARVQYEMETCLPPDVDDVEFAEAALALVERVAEFEEIKLKRRHGPTRY